MKFAIVIAVFLPLCAASGSAQPHASFLENKGQWDTRAIYLLHNANTNFWITDSGMVYDLFQITHLNTSMSSPQKRESRFFVRDSRFRGNDNHEFERTRSGQVVRVNFLHTAQPEAISENPETGTTNYFIGNDPGKWVTGARSFDSVTIRNLYEGVEAVFSLDHGSPRYDLIVRPGFDPSTIEMQIDGADSIRVNGPDERRTFLRIYTTMGTIEERELFAYQETNGIRQQVDCKFQISSGNHIFFQLGSFDRAKPLVIDPLIFSTYVGGGGDAATAIAVDRFGNSYVTGWTVSQSFPVTTGAYQQSGYGSFSRFVSKLNANGSALVYATYLGGSDYYGNNGYYFEEAVNSIAIDTFGNAYIVGGTDAKDFPTTSGAFQRASKATNSGYYSNAFVTKLNATGSALMYSTYLGGSNGYWDGGGEWGSGIAVDSIGEAFVVGTTSSSDFPVTSGAFQTKNPNFSYNIESDGRSAFLTKLNARGSGLIYSTYLGGSTVPNALPGFAVTNANAIAVDRGGNVFIAGWTAASDFPTTSGAFETSNSGSYYGYTSFISKFNSSGSALLYSTYLGGKDSMEEISSIAIDSIGEAFVTGWTGSKDFPVTSGAFQQTKRGIKNAFVTKLNAAGSGLVYSTFLGSSGSDVANAIALDDSGNIYIAGGTSWSNDFPMLPGAIQTMNKSVAKYAQSNAFVSELNASGSRLLYSSYLGGMGSDQANGIALDSSHNIYVAGSTSSGDFPVTEGVLQRKAPNGVDSLGAAFVTKLSPLTLYIAADSTLRDFGAGSLCRSADTSIIFSNAGTDSLLIKEIILSGHNFSLLRQSSPGVLLPGESDTAIIAYNPALGNDTAFLTITSNAANDSVMVIPLAARSIPTPFVHFHGSLTKATASPKDTTTLSMYADSSIAHIGLNSLKMTITFNSDLLTLLHVSSPLQVTTISNTSGGRTDLEITLSGTNISLDPSISLVTLLFGTSVSDSASTQIRMSDPILNSSDSAYGICVLSATGSSTTFSLAFSCGDSLLRNALDKNLVLSIKSIAPNPASSLVTVESNEPGDAPTIVEISDRLGRIVQRVRESGPGPFDLDTHSLPAGVYVLLLRQRGGVAHGSFVVER